jgi:hypothetical protein
MKMGTRSRTKAWAIAIDIGSFAGVFMFHRGGALNPWQDGMRTCLFSNRREARKHCMMIAPIYKPRVVRVEVTIERGRGGGLGE